MKAISCCSAMAAGPGYGPPAGTAPKGISVMRRACSRVLEFDPIAKEIIWEYAPNSASTPNQKSGYGK